VVLGPVAAGLIGLLFWFIQRTREWELYRETQPLAYAVYEEMKLCYANFQSLEGIQYLSFIKQLTEALGLVGFKYGTISDVNALSAKQRQDVAKHVATALNQHAPARKIAGIKYACSEYSYELPLDMLMQKEDLMQIVAEQVVSLVGVVSIEFDVKRGLSTSVRKSTVSGPIHFGSSISPSSPLAQRLNGAARSSVSTITPFEVEGQQREEGREGQPPSQNVRLPEVHIRFQSVSEEGESFVTP
jgi:hypothetical protein